MLPWSIDPELQICFEHPYCENIRRFWWHYRVIEQKRCSSMWLEYSNIKVE